MNRPANPSASAYAQAKELDAAGRYRDAVALLEQHVSEHPGDVSSVTLLGLENARLGHWGDALAAYLLALDAQPDDPATLVQVGKCQLKLGDFAAAESVFQRALLLDAGDESIPARYVAAVLRTKELDRAEETLAELYGRAPSLGLGLALARIVEAAGKHAEAIALLEPLAAGHPDTVDAQVALGKLYAKTGEAAKAVQVLEDAVARGARINAQVALAAAYRAAGDLPGAQRVLSAAVVDRPNTASLWTELARVAELARDEDAAGTYAARAREATERVAAATQRIESAPVVGTRWDLIDECLERKIDGGLIMEFGVAAGTSIRYLASRCAGAVYGFDSFEGLPESGDAWTVGQFARAAPPLVPDNVELKIGWFSDTLPPFLREHDGAIAFLHIDCDIYESTRFVFEEARDRLVDGTVILFDELWRFGGWENHEWRALEECLLEHGVQVDFIGRVSDGAQVAVRVRR